MIERMSVRIPFQGARLNEGALICVSVPLFACIRL